MITIVTKQYVEIPVSDSRFDELSQMFRDNPDYDDGCYNCDGTILTFKSILNVIDL